MSRNSDAAVAAIAQRQHAVISRRQVLRAGLTADMVDYRLELGRWRMLHSGVYLLGGSPMTWEARAQAAVLTGVEGSLVSHLCAAHLWGFDGFGPAGVIDITVPRHQRPRPHKGVRYHESLAFDLAGASTRKGLAVTGAARTILDVCGIADSDLRRLAALDDALRRRLVTWPELWECLVLHACRGRRGIRAFRRVLFRRYGKSIPEGHFARLANRALEDAGVPPWEHEYPVVACGRRYRLDIAWPELKVAVELDGRVGHDHAAAYESDPVRRNHLELEGWLVLHFTWRRFIDDPGAFVIEVRRAVALRSGVR